MKRGKKLRKKIAFFGHFGMGNFGNESTLQAIIYHLRRFAPDAQLSCIATGPQDAAAIHHIEATPISETFFKSREFRNPLARLIRKLTVGITSEVYRWAKGIATLWHADMLIVPGTGLLTDVYGLLNWGPYNLFRWSLTAKLCRCKLLFVSVGAGPIYGSFAKWLVKSSLSLADFRSYRDSPSAQYLENIGFRMISDRVYPDLAFSLPDHAISPQLPRNRCKPVIGLGLMPYAGRYSAANPRNETYVAYLENLAKVVKWLVARQYGVSLLIGNSLDTPVTQEFRSLLQKHLSDVTKGHIADEPQFCGEDLLLQLAATDLVVATRYHNVIMALLNNKPVIAISHHPKCDSLMRAMGLSEYCLDIHTLSADNVITKIRHLEKNASALKSSIKKKNEEFRKALDEQYALIFGNILLGTPNQEMDEAVLHFLPTECSAVSQNPPS